MKIFMGVMAIVVLATGWAVIVTFFIPCGFLVKSIICLFGGATMGLIVVLVLRRQLLKSLKRR